MKSHDCDEGAVIEPGDIIEQIRRELLAQADSRTKKSYKRFFKEPVLYYGVRSKAVGLIAREYWKQAKLHDKRTLLAICEELYKSDYGEESGIASSWIGKIVSKTSEDDLASFKRWIISYINNWGKCDGFCGNVLSLFIERFPSSIPEIVSWTASKNRWLRRSSAVSFVRLARKGECIDICFTIADALLTDPDDLVQKGYGWLLKEASRKHEREVFDYVNRNKVKMPRTALRYAIELMNPALRSLAMKK
jgi:3-methyladenine DNA glycosylase AlkD